jgi:predicted metal-dependent phosphoesterase TrpH
MTERMAAAGVPIRWERVAELAAGASAGRPHIARALVEAGIVDSVDEAFATLLSSRSPYHEPKEDLDALTGVRLVLAAGGVPVFAHPLARARGRVVGDDAIRAMVDAGLAGLEIDHPRPHRDRPRAPAARSRPSSDCWSPAPATTTAATSGCGSAGAAARAPDQYEKLLSLATGTPALTG